MISRMIEYLSRKKLSVFLFHKVPKIKSSLAVDDIDLQEFIRILDVIETHFKVIPLDEVYLKLNVADSLPDNPACITFDDGYLDWIDGVVPELLSRNLHATFFITTCQFDGVSMWHERILHAVEKFPGDHVFLVDSGLPLIVLNTEAERIAAVKHIEAHLKYQSFKFRDQIIQYLEEMSGSHLIKRPVISVNNVREMHSKGFSIGAHTINHPILRMCDPQTALDEIGGGREVLENIVRGKVNMFAYPNGHPVIDFAERHIQMVRDAGYRCAVTTQAGAWSLNECAFQIPRFTPWGPTPIKMDLQIMRNFIFKPKYLKNHV
jgi:peptidoglycan/xylan/chitin deacetylase (PgdA/CDA1 family)